MTTQLNRSLVSVPARGPLRLSGICALSLATLLAASAQARPVDQGNLRANAPAAAAVVKPLATPHAIGSGGSNHRPSALPNCGPNGERICTPHGCYCG